MDFLQKWISDSVVGGKVSFTVAVVCVVWIFVQSGFASSLLTTFKDNRRNRIKDRRQRFEYCRALLADERAPVSAELKAELSKECERLAFEEATGIRTDYEKIGSFLKLANDGKISRKTLEGALEKLELVNGEFCYKLTRRKRLEYYFSEFFMRLSLCFSFVAFILFYAKFSFSKQVEWAFLIDAVEFFACFVFFALTSSKTRCAWKVGKALRETEKKAAASK